MNFGPLAWYKKYSKETWHSHGSCSITVKRKDHQWVRAAVFLHDGDRMYVVEKRMQPGDSNMLHFLVPPGRYAVFFITDGNTGCRCHLNLNEPNASVKVGMGILGGGNRKVYYGDKYVMSRGVEVLKSKIDWAATARGLFLGEVGGAITSS